MFKKSTLALSTIAVLSLSSISAQITNCTQNSNCTGYFYEDINAAFIDCYDMNGMIIERKENFYTSTLEKECNSTSFSAFNQTISGPSMFAPVAANATVAYCDYFEIGTGYQFTQADNGIGLVVVESIVDSVRDLYYKNLNITAGVLYWDWTQLAQLVENYTAEACTNGSALNVTTAVNVTVGINIPEGLEEIVAWITKFAEQELAQLQAELTPVNSTVNITVPPMINITIPVVNVTIPVVNITNITNETAPSNITNGTVGTIPSGSGSVANQTNSTSNETIISLPIVNSTDNGTLINNVTFNFTNNSTVNSTVNVTTNITSNVTTNMTNNATTNETTNVTTISNLTNSTNDTTNITTNATINVGFYNSGNYSLPAGCSYSDSSD
jgi:hypothetical protein